MPNPRVLRSQLLLDIVPKGQLRETVFSEYSQFLRGSPVERNSPAEWAYHLEELLKWKFEENDRPEFIRSIVETGDSTMRAYAELVLLESHQTSH